MITSLILKSCTNYIDTLSVNKNKISCLLSLKQYGRNLIGLLLLYSFVFLQLCSIEETLCRRGTGGWKDWELSCGKRLGDTDGWKIGHEPAIWSCSPHFPPLLCTDETSTEGLCPVMGSCDKNSVDLLEQFRGGLWKWSEGWGTSPVAKGWESCSCSAERREGSMETLLWHFNI